MEETFFGVVYALDKEKLIEMVENGLSLSTVNQYVGVAQKNVGMEVFVDSWGEKTFEILDILLENGLDIDHQDSDGSTLLIYLLDYVGWWDYGEDLLIEKVGSKFELQDIIRLRETFDKIMTKNPDLTISNNYSIDVFQVAINGKSSYWFEKHLDQMSNENRELYESYRLARLFENQ